MLSYEAERKIKDLERKVQRIVVNRCEEMPTTNVGKIVIFESEIFFWNGAEYERVLTTDDLAGLVTEEELAWLTQDIEDALVNANLPSETNPYATMDDVNAIVFPDPITVVANYAALPDPTTVGGDFYWAENSQGTSWLPGSLGGTYYPKGMYYSNGVSWSYLETPYQATQLEVDTGTNNDKFVTPLTGKTAYSFKPGIAGGQLLNGGINASDNLTLSSTANATKGSILFGDSRYNEATNRFVLGTATGTGRINLPDAGTTAADGIAFGSTLSLFRLSSTIISLNNNTSFAANGYTTPNFSGVITFAGYSNMNFIVNSLTGSSATSALSISQTWNTTGAPTAIDLNITDTASNAGSLFVNLRRNGSSVFSISKTGITTSNGFQSIAYNESFQRVAFNSGSNFIARSYIRSSANGVLVFLDNTETDFNRVTFGGTTSSFPALKRSTTTLQVRLADDSNFGGIQSLYQRFGSGSPEGVVTAPMGAIYHNTDGGAGTSVYVKESGSGNTGWTAK